MNNAGTSQPTSKEAAQSREAAASRVAPVELTVVIPTLDERNSVPLLVERLDAVLAGISRLSSAAIEGILASAAPYVAVMA
jgi:hypothetical protein